MTNLLLQIKPVNSTLVGGIFCAGGDTKFGLFCDAVAMWVVMIPLGALAAFVWKWAPVWVYAVLSMDELIKMPVVIEDGCWIGVGSVIGAGSVVTKDIPPMSVAVGNPCRVLRPITEEDLAEEKALR